MGPAHHRLDEVGRVAADLRQGRGARQPEAVRTHHLEAHHRAADVVEGEAIVEQAHERPERAGGGVVLGLAEQQGRAALEVAQVDVVAEARPDDALVGGDHQGDLGLGVVPLRARMQAGLLAAADRRERLGLGEDLGIRADADLEVLAPRSLRHQHRLERHRLGRAGLQAPQVVADEAADLEADRRRGVRVAACPLLDHPLQHRDREGHAGGLDRLEVDGGQEPGPRRVAGVRRSVGQHRVEGAERLARGGPQGARRIGRLAQVADRREGAGDVDELGRARRAVAYGDDAGAVQLRPPDAAGERPGAAVLRQDGAGVEGIEDRLHGCLLPAGSRSAGAQHGERPKPIGRGGEARKTPDRPDPGAGLPRGDGRQAASGRQARTWRSAWSRGAGRPRW